MENERQAITEEDGVHEEWVTQAKACKSMEDLTALYEKLTTEYDHDYDTTCHAVVAMALAGMHAMDRSSQGGITGFQASCIMWMVMREWTDPGRGGPMKLLAFNDLLYPQMDYKFEKVLSREDADWLREEAERKIASDGAEQAAIPVMGRWLALVTGGLPSGWKVAGETRCPTCDGPEKDGVCITGCTRN